MKNKINISLNRTDKKFIFHQIDNDTIVEIINAKFLFGILSNKIFRFGVYFPSWLQSLLSK